MWRVILYSKHFFDEGQKISVCGEVEDFFSIPLEFMGRDGLRDLVLCPKCLEVLEKRRAV